jgi:predicted O-methyltransferase YrrM
MKFQEISSLVTGIPFISQKRAKELYDFILDRKPANILELGFAHGSSSCYIAAALDEIGTGHLTAVDLLAAKVWQNPSIEELLTKTRLEKYVTVDREMTSYTWFLKKKIEENTISNICQPIYDFCFIDGAKNWTIDSSAFFLADKLLKQNGWILFDDLKWTYSRKLAAGQTRSDGITIREMGEDEIHQPHLDLIFRLLVMQHPDYCEFKITDDNWGWAHKKANFKKNLVITESYDLKSSIYRLLKQLKNKYKKKA